MKKRRVARIVASLLVLAMLCTAFGMVTFAAGPTVTITEIQAAKQDTYWQMSVPYTVTGWTDGMQLAVLAYDVTSITENPESAAYSESTPIGYITQADAPNGEGTFSFRARMGEMGQGDTVAAFEGGDKILVKIGGSGVATPAAMLYTFPGGSTTPSDDASITGITLGGQSATTSNNTDYTITVPEDTTIDQSAIEAAVATTDSGATVSAAQGADNLHWNITVTAADGETTASYTLTITLSALVENDEDVAAMQAAITAVAGSAETPSTTFSYAQDSLSGDSDEEKKADLAGKIAATAAELTPVSGASLFDLSSNGVNVTANVTDYAAAKNGDRENWAGTAGSATATVTLTKGAVATANVIVYAALTPTEYTPSNNAALQSLTISHGDGQSTAVTIPGDGSTNLTVTLPYGTTVEQADITATPADTNAQVEVSGSGDSWTITVTAENETDTKTYNLTISYTEDPDIAVVAGVKGAISTAFAAATMDGSSATTAADAKAVAEGILSGVELNGVTAEIDGDGAITTAAIDATKTDLDGTDGTYTATINLGLRDAEDSVTVTITIKPAALQAIDSVQANVTGPVYGVAPADATLVDGSENYTITSTVWSPNDATFAYGKEYTATVTFTPNTGYIFVIEGDAGDGTSYTRTYEFEALTEPTFTITKGAETNGTFTVSPEGPAAAGTEITVTATPAEHYVVDTMTYTGSGAAQDISFTGNTGTFNMPAENVTVNVTFKMNEDYAAVTAAAEAVNGMTFNAIAQATANTEDAVKAIIEGLVAEDGLTAVVNTASFTAAVAGDAVTPAGTNGTYAFTVTYSQSGESATSVEKTVTITATRHTAPPIEGAQNVTLGLEATSDPAVFDIVLTPDAGQAITRFNAAEFTLVQNVTSGTISSVVTAGEGLNIIPDAVTEGKYLVSLQVAADGTTTPITKGTDEKLILGQITLSGIAEGSLGVTAAKGYMESEVNNEVVELNVTAAADENFSLQVETVPVTVRVDFINAVDTTKDADYTDMTVTVTSALGSTVYDLSSANAVAGLDDDKTAFEVETEMVAGIRYTVKLQGGGYRDASKTITPAAGGGETVYFWNNVMTEGQTLPDGETAATAENNKNFVAGDIQMDNRIDIYDLNAVVSYFGMIDMDQDYNTYSAYIRYDLNRDGKIDARDVAMVLVSWGE